jgi:hypothetical protein
MRKSSGTISARSSPPAKTRTTELCDTTTANARVVRETEAAAAWRVPRPGEVRRRVHIDVDEAPGCHEDAVVAEHEGAVQLRELLHRLTKLGKINSQDLVRMPVQRIE